MAAGAALRGLAVRALGDDFVSEVTPRREQPLVRRSVYRYLRHPSEWGLLLAVVGAATVLESPSLALITASVLLPLTRLRVRLEERELRQVYADY